MRANSNEATSELSIVPMPLVNPPQVFHGMLYQQLSSRETPEDRLYNVACETRRTCLFVEVPPRKIPTVNKISSNCSRLIL